MLAITGHRPEDIPDPTWARQAIRDAFVSIKPSKVIVGMAAGVDLWAGEIALDMGIAVLAARPWVSHTWRAGDAALYQRVLQEAVEVVVVDPAESYPGPWVYHKRNEWMVDHADQVLAVWSGKRSGGTYACLSYALKRGKSVNYIRVDSRQTLLVETGPAAHQESEQPELPF